MVVITGKTKPVTLYFARNTDNSFENYMIRLTKGNKSEDIVPTVAVERLRFIVLTLDLSGMEDGEYTYKITPSGETGLMQIINTKSNKTYKKNEEYQFYKG